MNRKLDFIIIGTQKAGTSALDYYLRQHPQVGMAARKELHFFDDDQLFVQGRPVDYGRLESQFVQHDEVLVYGEVTPVYLFWEPCMKRIWEYNPQIKLIAILRNPILRAYSHWAMDQIKHQDHTGFLQCVQHELKEYLGRDIQDRRHSKLARGFYSNQIRRVLQYFPNDQLHFIKYENFRSEQHESLNRIFTFLRISPSQFYFTESSILPGKYAAKITKEEFDFCLSHFSREIEEVEHLLGWDCSDWREYQIS